MTIKELRATLSALETVYTATRDGSNNPHETARTFIRSVGADTAAQCVAAMIRRASWDGRISRTAKGWARGVTLSDEWARHIDDTYCDAIHAAHLSQIAEAMPAELEFCAAEAETRVTALEGGGQIMTGFEERRRMADLALWKELNRMFPNLACNVRFEHQDAAGWWYTFELVNDTRRQTIRVNPETAN